MKKLIKFLLIAIPVLFLAGCTTSADDEPAQKPSGENPGQNPGQDPNPGPEQTFKGKTVNLIYAYDLESIDDDAADMFTHVCIAFLQHNADSTTLTYDKSDDLTDLKKSIKNFKAAHPNVKVLISYGGGDTGSENASTVLNSDKYDELVANIANFVNLSGVDGIDFDWEYFGSYKTYNPIYPKFVSDIKRLTNNSKIYTIAAQTGSSFYGNSGIQEMLKTLDLVNVMTYDFDYSSRGDKDDGTTPYIGYNGNFKSTKDTVEAYIKIVGAEKTVIGLPFYGIGYRIDEGYTAENIYAGNKEGLAAGYYGTEDGFYKIYGFTKGKCLTDAKYVTGDSQEGAVAYYIGTRSTKYSKPDDHPYPFLYFFDDPKTIDIKVKWALDTKCCIGAMAWVYEDDTKDGILRKAMTDAVKKYSKYETSQGGSAENPENPPAPGDNNIKDGLKSGIKSYIITDVAGLKKLSELVNGGNTLEGCTITVANDITINSKVLKDGFLEPDEGANCTPNASLVNLDSIGMRKIPFCGTFDGNNKIISGLYMYQSHEGLALIGEAGDGAVIKNVILRDACVINSNASNKGDGSDDDRFGLLVGDSEIAAGAVTIQDCIVEGVVGSAAAVARDELDSPDGAEKNSQYATYEYGAGILGEVGKSGSTAVITIKNCTALVRNYTKADKVIVNKERITANQENNHGYSADTQLTEGIAAIDAAVAAARQ